MGKHPDIGFDHLCRPPAAFHRALDGPYVRFGSGMRPGQDQIGHRGRLGGLETLGIRRRHPFGLTGLKPVRREPPLMPHLDPQYRKGFQPAPAVGLLDKATQRFAGKQLRLDLFDKLLRERIYIGLWPEICKDH